MDYKSVFTNLCLELQQNRSWIKGLGKNPQKSELIHWRQCLLSGGTEACSLGLRETPACIHVIQRLSQPRVACWHGFRQNSQKTKCVFTVIGIVARGVSGCLLDTLFQFWTPYLICHLHVKSIRKWTIWTPCFEISSKFGHPTCISKSMANLPSVIGGQH